MSASIPRDRPITITLMPEQWQLTLQLISSGAGALVAEIQRQCMQHATAQWQPRANGGSPAGSEDISEEASP
jgi:hypothetical protein